MCLLQALCSWWVRIVPALLRPAGSGGRSCKMSPLTHCLLLLLHTSIRTCSACLGLPFVAWWTALQRQRVAAKHSVDDSREPGWLSTALFPCSLLQMHALLQQAAALHQQQQAAAPPPHKAPKMQAMTGAPRAAADEEEEHARHPLA